MSEPVACLAVVMPCYNERADVGTILDRVLASPWVAEVVVVDDGSDDGTGGVLAGIDDRRVRVLTQPMNLGKGAALRRGFREVTAPYVVVQDADLEYDPADFGDLLEPLLAGRADAVFGSRFLSGRPRRVLYYWHSVGNRMLTTLSNAFTNLNLTDVETCYKAFRREVIQSIDLEEDRFGFEPEVTAKVAKAGWRVYEVGISYAGRTYAEGKKTGWRDGMRAVYGIVKYSRLADRFAAAAVDRDAELARFDESDSELAESLDNLQSADNYADWIVDLVAPHLGAKVLEVGAGHGELTERFAARHRVTATDVSPRCVEVLEQRFAGNAAVAVHLGTLETLAGAGTYDAAVFVNVLEHIEDDVAVLRQTRDLLRPGGRVVVYAPAFEGLYSEFDRRVGHHRRYRLPQLVERAGEADLAIVDARYVNAVGALIWWVYARHLRQTPTEGWSSTLFDRLMVPGIRRYESRRPPGFGQSVLLVAERPAA
jgi:2-polyprenyl-3-methyl-5-hydroxy-6-metoxy-1,4-benzoquinol methylase